MGLKMDEPLVSIVIVTRNRKKDVIECLQSILRMNYANLELILVDNNSTDGTVEEVRHEYPNVTVISNNVNLGLTGGRNIGMIHSSGKYILFLDSDTILTKNTLRELVEFLEDNQSVGIAGPKILSFYEPELIWYAGARFSLLTSRAENVGAWKEDDGAYDHLMRASHVPTAFLVRSDLAKKLGGHDDLFFMSYGDADFAFRARNLGYNVIYDWKAVMFHKVPLLKNLKSLRALGMDTPNRAYYYGRNKILFMKRYANKGNFIVFLMIFLPIFMIFYTRTILAYGGGLIYLIQYLQGNIDGIKSVITGGWKSKFSEDFQRFIPRILALHHANPNSYFR
jgi:GT2 family glycosyltransferase